MLPLLLAVAVAAAPAPAPAPRRLAVLPVAAGDGVQPDAAAAVGEALISEIRRRAGAEVVSRRELEAVLSLERQQAMLGCRTDACLAELAGAVAADRVVVADLARVGESLLLHVRVVAVRDVRVLAQADRRLRGGGLDGVLDVLPGVAAELFPATGAAGATVVAPAPPPVATRALAPPAVEVEEPAVISPEVRAQLRAFTDGKGSWVLAVPYGDSSSPLFAGDGKRFWRVRVRGSFRNPGDKEWSRSFWDPRSAPEQMVPTFEGEAPALWCSGQKIAWHAAGDPEERRIVEGATLLEARWRRYPHALARDDDGHYYLLDGLRKADGEPAGKDHRLWFGPKRKMVQLAVEEVQEDSGGLLVLTAEGRLKARPAQDGTWAAEWIAPGGARRPLTWLEPIREHVLLYREASAWAGRPLGTPCDAFFAAP